MTAAFVLRDRADKIRHGAEPAFLAPPPARRTAQVIRDDAQALAVAAEVAAELALDAAARDRDRILPGPELDRLSDAGLFAITVPKAYGGAAVRAGTVARVIALLAGADGSIGQIPQNHFFMLEALRLEGSEAQKRFFYGRVLAGERIFNALSEKGTKTAQDHATRLTSTQDGYRLDGRKFYSTGALFADWVAVVANDDDGRSSLAFVPRQAPGLSVIDDWSGFGQRITGSGTTMLDNVSVHPFAVFDFKALFERPTAMGPFAQIMHAAVEQGIAEAALAETVRFVRTVSRPWKDSGVEQASLDPYVVTIAGEMKIRTDAAGALLDRAGHFVDDAQAKPDDAIVAAALGGRGRGQDRLDRRRPVRRLEADRTRRVERDLERARARPILAQRPHPYGARSDPLEIQGRRRLLAQRHQPAAPRRHLGGACSMKTIALNAFDMNCVGHQSPGLWAHPRDRSAEYKDLAYWTELATLLERGKFDGLFIADVLGVYDVFNGSVEAALRNGAQVPVNDPLQLVPAMALVTEHLGFGLTASLSFEHPYTFARRLSTLDHLTKGRAGWNIVTSYLDSGAKNIGFGGQAAHDDRYDVADEYLEVCYKLWEGSWEDGAVLRDRERRLFTDPAKVHPIGHTGRFYTVPGIHLCEPSPQRTPVLYQAGASSRGRRFAGQHAECVFVACPTKPVLKQTVAGIRAAVAEAGRDPASVKIFNLQTVIVDQTDARAQAKWRDYKSYISRDGALVLASGWLGIDFGAYGIDEPLRHIQTNAVQSSVDAFSKADPSKVWTVGELADWIGIGGLGPLFVGGPATVADLLEEWVADTDVDGFNLAYAMTPETFSDVVEHLVPELQRRGVYKQDYAPGTLREKLFGAGPRLPADHVGASYRDLGRRVAQPHLSAAE